MATSFHWHTDILALDFDGVIADSIDECLVSGHNAFATLQKDAVIKTISELPTDWQNQGRAIRNFIRVGEDYVYIALALHQQKQINSQADFDAFKQQHIRWQQQFAATFLQTRSEFAERNARKWAELSPLYPGMAALLKNANAQNLYIITTKKLTFVEKILAANDVELAAENLFDTSDGRSKRQIITDILSERQWPVEHFYFVDDQVDTLIKCQPSGVHLALASWGYNNAQQQQIAQQHNIPVFSLLQFIEFFSEDV